MNESTYLLGIDIGTSSTKTGLWRSDGTLIAEATAPYPLHRPQPTHAQQDANDWWHAVCVTVGEVLHNVNPAQVVGVGVDGLGWSPVPVDAKCNPLFPAMIWLDRRAESQAAQLRALPQADTLVHLVANPLDAAYITPKLVWLKQHHPDVFEKTHAFLPSSSFITAKLTGEFTCDYTQAYGFHCFDIRNERWDEDAAAALGIPLDKLPALHPSHAVVGKVTSAAAEATGLVAGTSVIAGALDAAAGAFGSGVARVGQTSDQGGTAFGLSLCVDRVIEDQRLIFSHHVVPGTYIFQGGTVGGGVFPWFKDTLGYAETSAARLLNQSPYDLMTNQAAQSVPGAHGLVYLPYMAGERSPLWNSDARGVLYGLSFNTARADIIRAVMEGCIFAVRHNVAVMETHGVRVAEWIGIGGAANSDVWCQMKADISGRPFTVPRRANGQPGDNTLGLAVMVMHALGLCDDMADQIDAFLPQRRTYHPSADHRKIYDEVFAFYLSLSETMLPLFEQGARLADDSA